MASRLFLMVYFLFNITFSVVSLSNQEKIDFLVLDSDYDHDNVIVYKFLDAQKSSYIVFVKDDESNNYVVKQEKYKELKRQFRAISEALCAHIALSLDIPSQQVKIIPVGTAFPGKFVTKRVATLHTLVPGVTIRSLKSGSLYSSLDIKQDASEDTPVERRGLTEKIIYWMSQHPDLPLIVALDTFTGNKDRNKANILYDQETDRFYSIDMALMYDIFGERRSLAQLACDQVNGMIKRGKVFTEKEREALIAYRSMLKKLVYNFNPKIMCQLFDDFFLESKIVKTSLFGTKEIMASINEYKRSMRESYIDIKKLIYLLLILINQ